MDNYRPKSITEHLDRTTDAIEVPSLRSLLHSYFPDVSRVIVSVNLCAQFGITSEPRVAIYLMQTEGIGAESHIQILVVPEKENRIASTILLGRLFREHPIIADPVPPLVAHYYAESVYLGTILIPGSVSAAQKDAHLRVLTDQEEFFRESFGSVIQNAQHHKPYSLLFCNKLDDVARDCSLTPREHEVFVYHLFGEPHARIGELLNISTNTVHNHVSAIHRKTGSRNIGEIFVQYFTPLSQGRILKG